MEGRHWVDQRSIDTLSNLKTTGLQARERENYGKRF